MDFKSHIWKKKKLGLVRVLPGRPAGLPGFSRAVATTGLLLNPDRSSHRVDPLGRAGFNNSGFYTPIDVRKQISLTWIFHIKSFKNK
jgi:hypothetical protein